MTKDRVTYFSNYDGSIGMYRPRFIEVLGAPELVCASLADALELYHVKLFVDNGLLKPSFPNEVWASYQSKVGLVPGLIARYIKSVPGSELVKEYINLDYSHLQSFWDILEGFGQEDKLTEDDLMATLEKKNHSLAHILRCKKVVRANSAFLREYMMERPKSAEIVLAQRVERQEDDFRPFCFPEGLDVISLLEAYVNLKEPNANYLRMILNARDDELTVPPDIKIQAKNKMKELRRKNESSLYGFSGRYGVEFSDRFSDVKALSVAEDGTQVLQYDSRFFLGRNDVEVILSLGPIFEYLDSDRLITLVNKDSESNVFERCMMKARSEYAPNINFTYKAGVAVAQLACLHSLLKADGRSIETAVESFYNDYLKNSFGLPFSEISLLKEGAWKDKAKVLLPLFDALVKQYNLFVTRGQVTHDLMQYCPGIPVTDAGSLVQRKYCQIMQDKEELNSINYLLFSEQSLLCFVDPYKDKQYKNLFELMSKEEVKYESYEDYQKLRIDVLIDQGFVSVSEKGALVFTDPNRIDVLSALYHKGACSFWRRPPEQRIYLLELLEKGWATEDNHLLCKPEREYFSYYLNDRQFSDAESLRNRFLHGVSDDVSADDYYRLLLLFVLLLLKMDDDLRQYAAIARTYM